MVGLNADVTAVAFTLASRLAAFRSANLRTFSFVRLKACATRTPPSSSCKSADTSPRVLRVLRKAWRARPEKKRVVNHNTGSMTNTASPSRQLMINMAIEIPETANTAPIICTNA